MLLVGCKLASLLLQPMPMAADVSLSRSRCCLLWRLRTGLDLMVADVGPPTSGDAAEAGVDEGEGGRTRGQGTREDASAWDSRDATVVHTGARCVEHKRSRARTTGGCVATAGKEGTQGKETSTHSTHHQITMISMRGWAVARMRRGTGADRRQRMRKVLLLLACSGAAVG